MPQENKKISLSNTLRSAYLYFSALDNKEESEKLQKILISLLNNTDFPVPSLPNSRIWPAYFSNIYVSPLFTASEFILKKGYAIPLHNHPNQVVFSKILYGSMRMMSYDFITPNKAKKTQDLIMNSSGVSVVYPDKFNLHYIEALEEVAFVDLIYPPYDDDERECLYYRPISGELWADEVELEKFHPSKEEFHLEHFQLDNFGIDLEFIKTGRKVNSNNDQSIGKDKLGSGSIA